MKKILALGVILLFIGVTVAPSINFNTVKASTDDDLVEVTTQACGIKGYKDTKVKLTREQYRELEQYLVEFRARLNQTSTREEAIPLFKEAVVELDKYRLLPKGMSVEQIQRLIIRNVVQKQKISRILDTSVRHNNIFCFIAGSSSGNAKETVFQPLRNKIIYNMYHQWIFGPLLEILFIVYTLGLISLNLNPIKIGCLIYYGYHFIDHMTGIDETYYSEGNVWTMGVFGQKSWDGSMIGSLGLKVPFHLGIGPTSSAFYCGAIGFTGISLLLHNQERFYLGFALYVDINSN
jgi:hypothetical protein